MGFSECGKMVITATETGKIQVAVRTVYSYSIDKITCKVDGEALCTDYSSSTWVTKIIEVAEGQTITVDVDYLNKTTNTSNRGHVEIKGKCSYTTTAEDSQERYVKAYVEGTGTAGGWLHSEMRQYYIDVLKPLIPENVRNRIVAVTKTHPSYNPSTMQEETQTTQDEVWMPSYIEMYGGFSSGGIYRTLFTDNASRVKRKVGSSSASWWWLRAYAVGSSGSNGNSRVYYSGDVPLGFST